MKPHITKHRVRYDECDMMGIVHNSKYYQYMEIARLGLVREEGYSYLKMEEEGAFFPVLESGCKFFNPARFEDIISIKTTLGFLKNASIRFNYKMVNSKDELINEGFTIHACVDKSFEILLIPEEIRKVFEKYKEE